MREIGSVTGSALSIRRGVSRSGTWLCCLSHCFTLVSFYCLQEHYFWVVFLPVAEGLDLQSCQLFLLPKIPNLSSTEGTLLCPVNPVGTVLSSSPSCSLKHCSAQRASTQEPGTQSLKEEPAGNADFPPKFPAAKHNTQKGNNIRGVGSPKGGSELHRGSAVRPGASGMLQRTPRPLQAPRAAGQVGCTGMEALQDAQGGAPEVLSILAQLLTSQPPLPALPWLPQAGTEGQQNARGFASLPQPTAPGPGLAMKCGFHCTRAGLDGKEAPKAAELPLRRKRSLPRQCGTNLQGWIMSCSRKGIRAATGSTESSSGSCSPSLGSSGLLQAHQRGRDHAMVVFYLLQIHGLKVFVFY